MRLSGDRCQCTVCGEFFNSTSAFDRHRVGPYSDRQCRSTQEMILRGMAKNAQGFWVGALSNFEHRKTADV